MANKQHLDILKQGVQIWNQWREVHPDIVHPDLSGADLEGIQLQGAELKWVNLERANLRGAHLENANLTGAHLEDAHVVEAHLEGANMPFAHLEKARLIESHLEKAILYSADLKSANIGMTHLEEADLTGAHLEGAELFETHLEGAELDLAFLDNATMLKDVFLANEKHGSALLVDVSWGNVNLAMIDWAPVRVLGDECKARQKKKNDGTIKDRTTRLDEYRTAVRANRQLAVVLRNQGMNEEADHFGYRAQLLQQALWGLQRKWLKYVASWFLYLLAGYGYKPLRSFVAYLLLILGFAVAFYTLGHLAWYEALVVSLTAFHGRGFFSQQYQPGDPQSILAAAEAVVGLLIEISFIATFTSRFFSR